MVAFYKVESVGFLGVHTALTLQGWTHIPWAGVALLMVVSNHK
jgi:hypothetical protein